MPDNPDSLQTKFYRTMQLIRRSQVLLMEEYHPADEMRCPIHFCVGQEATPAALAVLFRPEDGLFTHHRSHGYYLAKGAPLDAMVAEFYGKKTGSNGGLAGSQELSHHGARFFSGTILSGAFALAVGDAFASKYNGTDNIAVGVIGDGGMEEGIVFEALNLVAAKNLPVLFVCENNGYSIHSPLHERSLSPHLAVRAQSFGLKTAIVDGMDVVAVHGTLKDVVAEIRAGNGPWFVEVQTYRYCAHVGPEDDDHFGYRPEEEIKQWEDRDPIEHIRAALIGDGLDPAEIKAIDRDIDEQVLAAIEAAKDAPFPSYDDALTYNTADDYAPAVTRLIEGSVADFDPSQQETKLGPY